MASGTGDRIKIAAQRLGGHHSLAEVLGVNERSVRDYIREDPEPKLDVFRKIAEATGVSLAWLVTGEDPSTAPIDLVLLGKCISETEVQETERGVKIDPENKALVVATLYKTLLANRPGVAENEDVAPERGTPKSGATHG